MWRNNDRRFGRYQKRLTVGLRLGDDARADASSRAGAIFDEESLAERLRETLREET
jgi:hypothetical protein